MTCVLINFLLSKVINSLNKSDQQVFASVTERDNMSSGRGRRGGRGGQRGVGDRRTGGGRDQANNKRVPMKGGQPRKDGQTREDKVYRVDGVVLNNPDAVKVRI